MFVPADMVKLPPAVVVTLPPDKIPDRSTAPLVEVRVKRLMVAKLFTVVRF